MIVFQFRGELPWEKSPDAIGMWNNSPERFSQRGMLAL